MVKCGFAQFSLVHYDFIHVFGTSILQRLGWTQNNNTEREKNHTVQAFFHAIDSILRLVRESELDSVDDDDDDDDDYDDDDVIVGLSME